MLKFETFVVNHFFENTFLVFDDESQEAIIIDPGANEKKIEEAVLTRKLKVRTIVCTHCHPDHIAGAHHYQTLYKAPFVLHRNELPILDGFSEWAPMLGFQNSKKPNPDGFIRGGDFLKIGAHQFEVLETPGHTPGGVCLHCASQKLLFTGDTLFQGSIGRTDLPGGDMELLLDSISKQLMGLASDTQVLPGHGEFSSVGRESSTNPFLI